MDQQRHLLVYLYNDDNIVVLNVRVQPFLIYTCLDFVKNHGNDS